MDKPGIAAASTPRPRHAEGTRAAILDAAKSHFSQFGYHEATLRGIAATANADVALVKRYFGGKDGLYQEALKSSFASDRLHGWRRSTFAQEVAEMMAGEANANSARTQAFQFLLRAATSPTTAPMLNAVVQERFLDPIRGWLGGEEADARARVLASTFIGFLVECLIRNRPLEGGERDAFVRRTRALFAGLITER